MTRPDLADPPAALLLGEWVDYTTGYRAGIRRDDLIERTRSFLLDYPAPEGYVLVNADMLAEALHQAMCDVSHHDQWSVCKNQRRYELIAASALAALKGPTR